MHKQKNFSFFFSFLLYFRFQIVPFSHCLSEELGSRENKQASEKRYEMQIFVQNEE